MRPRDRKAWIAARRERAQCLCRGGGKCLRAGSVSRQGPPQYLSPVQGAGDPRPGTGPRLTQGTVHRAAGTANVTTDKQQMEG